MAGAAHDLATHRHSALALWGVPAVALIAGGLADLEAWLWPPALAVMGAACLVNARRCGRLHCFLTGPFFLALAVVSLLPALGWLPDDGATWRGLGAVVLVGGVGLTVLPERLWGRYVGRG